MAQAAPYEGIICAAFQHLVAGRFETDDIEADVNRLKGLGYRFTSDEPRPGAHDTRVIFIHPKSTGGVLIELVDQDTARR